MDFSYQVVKDEGRSVWKVMLDLDEVDGATEVGRKRHRTSELRGEHPAYGCRGEDAEKIHIIGAACEWAAAKALELPMPVHIDTHGEADLPPDIQVRGTTWPTNRICRVFKRDHTGQRYLLVRRINSVVYHLMGWIGWKDAQQPTWWGPAFDRPGSPNCWKVPEGSLRWMGTFDWRGREDEPPQQELTQEGIKW